jgi:integrase
VSAVIGDGEKWFGPTWADIDKDLILTFTPSKTEDDEEAPENIQFDLKECPMVMEEISRIPIEERVGPLIVDMRTSRPYSQWLFRDLWRQCADRVGIPKNVQNRDLRAGGMTESQKAGARLEDVSKQGGHKKIETTAIIYQRDALEAHRRNAAARKAYRNGK